MVIVAETGLLVGSFLPGDSLLFTAGLLASQGVIHQPIWLVVLRRGPAGLPDRRRAGPTLLDSRLFRRRFVTRTEEFFDQYGARAIVLGRFIPVVRTFLPMTPPAVEVLHHRAKQRRSAAAPASVDGDAVPEAHPVPQPARRPTPGRTARQRTARRVAIPARWAMSNHHSTATRSGAGCPR